eukprot:gene19491-19918_t
MVLSTQFAGAEAMTQSTSFRRLWRRTSVVFSAALALSACSTYRGHKIGDYTDLAGQPKSVLPDGVPYALVKPQFRLTTAPAATADGKQTVSVTVVSIADSDQRYAVRLQSGPLANPDFKISFTTLGTVKTTTSSVTEQITPTVKAIGAFVVDLAKAGVVHAAKAPEPTDTRDKLIGLVQNVVGEQACNRAWDYPMDFPEVPLELLFPGSAPKSIGEALVARLKAYPTDDDLTKTFHYLTLGEQTCLKTILAKQADYDQARVAYSTNYPSAVGRSQFLDALQEGVEAGSVTVVANGTKWPASGPQLADQDALILAAQTVASFLVVKPFAEMGDVVWRAHHVLYVEAELDRIALLRLRNQINKSTARSLDRYEDLLRRQRAQAIGAADVYARTLPLQQFVAKLQFKSVRGGEAPASAEYVQYRSELDALNSQIEAKRMTLVATLTHPAVKPAAIEVLDNEPVCWLMHKDFDPEKPAAVKTACSGDPGGVRLSAADAAQVCGRFGGTLMRFAIVIVGGLLVAGCSSDLIVSQLNPRLAPGAAVDGIPVRVPRNYTVRLYRLSEDGKSYQAQTTTSDKTATIGDPEHLYVIGFKGNPLANPTVEIAVSPDGGVDHVNLASSSQAQASLTELGNQIANVTAQLATNQTAQEGQNDAYATALADYYAKLKDYCTASAASPQNRLTIKANAAALYGSEIKLRRAQQSAKLAQPLPFTTLIDPETDVGVGCPS